MGKKEENKTFKIKNRYVAGLATWLQAQVLGGKQSRERTRFVRVLSEGVDDVQEQRKFIVDKYVKKDKAGKPVKKKDKDGKEMLVMGKNADKAEVEFKEVLDEDFIIDILEGNKAKVLSMREVVLNTSYQFKSSISSDFLWEIDKWSAEEYEIWCVAFEEVDL